MDSKTVGQYADQVMTSVHEDMADGTMPRDVGSFSEMHDHVDANCYLIDLGLPIDSDADQEVLNAVSDEVDRRLAREAIALDTGARCECGRLVRFNGGSVARGHFVHIDDGSHQCQPCQFCPPIGTVTRTGTYLTEEGVESGTVTWRPHDDSTADER